MRDEDYTIHWMQRTDVDREPILTASNNSEDHTSAAALNSTHTHTHKEAEKNPATVSREEFSHDSFNVLATFRSISSSMKIIWN